jgi:predicted ATPase
MNGSGKSSVLQALGFVREFARGNAQRFFSERGWVTRDIRTKFGASSLIRIDLLLEAADGSQFVWQFNYGLKSKRNLKERVWVTRPGEISPRSILVFCP